MPLAQTLGLPSSCSCFQVSPAAGMCTVPLCCSPATASGTGSLVPMQYNTNRHKHNHFGSLQNWDLSYSPSMCWFWIFALSVASGTDGQTYRHSASSWLFSWPGQCLSLQLGYSASLPCPVPLHSSLCREMIFLLHSQTFCLNHFF